MIQHLLWLVRSDLAPEQSRAEFIGIFTLVTDMGATSGPLIVGFVSQATDLATCAAVVALMGLAGALWMGFCMRETAPRAKLRCIPLRVARPSCAVRKVDCVVPHVTCELQERAEWRVIELAEAAEGRAPLW
jgi:hypothetical protein